MTQIIFLPRGPAIGLKSFSSPEVPPWSQIIFLPRGPRGPAIGILRVDAYVERDAPRPSSFKIPLPASPPDHSPTPA